jgi:RNA polymerase sigma factor (sigma-70 family)
MDLVVPLARRLKRRLPGTFELDDLIQSGFLGLLRAAREQDDRSPERHWARYRIWTAMLDAVEAEWHWVTMRAELAAEVGAPQPQEPAPVSPLHERLAGALADLTPVQRHLIELVYEHGESLWRVGHSKAAGIGWRRAQREHQAALETLRAIITEPERRLPKAA